jgi:hypothetical protein
MKLISRKDAAASNLQRYYTGNPCKHGHDCERYTKSTNCLICQVEANQSERQKLKLKQYRSLDSTKEKSRIKSGEFHRKNRDRILLEMKARNKKYYLANKDKIIKATSEYQKLNATKRTRYKAQWANAKKATDPQFAALLMMRKLVARTCERIKQSRKQNTRTTQILGYTALEFKAHMERQFVAGMNWLNHGEWHVDHIIPLSSFNLLDESERKIANGLANLMPIWAKDNFKKSDSVLTLL